MFVIPLGGPSDNVPAPVAALVTLSGESIFSVSAGGVSVAILHVVADGTLWKQTTNEGSVQLDVATDWIIPNSAADSSYEVRYTNHTGNTAQFTSSAPEDVWIDLSVSRFFQLFAFPGGIFRTATFDVEIRKDGGAVLATASFTLTASKIL